MENLPSIIVVSCSSTKPKSLIKLITKESAKEDENGFIFQPWTIDTKYYTAKVNFIGLEENRPRSELFYSQVEAIILHMDSNKTTGLEDLKQWESLEKECEPEIKLLISNYCTDETKITKSQALEWCLTNGYEFIELYPSITQQQEDQNLIEEKFGVNRVIEALETHTWSNLLMKNTPTTLRKLSKTENNSEKIEGFKDEVDEFTELFSQLHLMKESLQQMPTSQRKQCAEQMVTAFWKAIGGEEEEILDV